MEYIDKWGIYNEISQHEKKLANIYEITKSEADKKRLFEISYIKGLIGRTPTYEVNGTTTINMFGCCDNCGTNLVEYRKIVDNDVFCPFCGFKVDNIQY